MLGTCIYVTSLMTLWLTDFEKTRLRRQFCTSTDNRLFLKTSSEFLRFHSFCPNKLVPNLLSLPADA